MQDHVVKRFVSRVDTSGGADACHPWKGAKTNGYGQLSVDGKLTYAHRFAYELAYGKIANNESYHGTVVRHMCHNRACCNVKHLATGTMRENLHDSITIGKFATSEMNRRAANIRWGNHAKF
jgi:hypothetical protein